LLLLKATRTFVVSGPVKPYNFSVVIVQELRKCFDQLSHNVIFQRSYSYNQPRSFYESVSPWTQRILLGPFPIFKKIRNFVFFAGVNGTGHEKLATKSACLGIKVNIT
jgi:hypothetical protein